MADGGGLPESPYKQGFRCEGVDPESLALALEAAFDYRGDVTLLLASGGDLDGYLCNRDRSAAEPFVEILPAAGGGPRRVPYRDIRGVAFTGRDTASGKSWATWMKQYEAKKAAEARGEKVGEVGLFPESLE